MTWSLFKGRRFFCPSLALLSRRWYHFNHAPVIPLFFWFIDTAYGICYNGI